MKKCACRACQAKYRKDRALRALNAPRGDDKARLAVAYDWFRAELAAFAAQPGGDSSPAAVLAKNVWEAAEMVNDMNEELADHGR